MCGASLWAPLAFVMAVFAPLAYAQARNVYLLELEAPPAAAVYAETAAKSGVGSAVGAVRRHLEEIERAQRAVLDALTAKSSIGVQLLYRTQRVYNGVAVEAGPARAAELKRLPGVKNVRPLHPMYLHTSTSMPFTSMPELWDGLGLGLTGEGIRIGIIDTGIDYLHQDFGGTGNPSDHASNNTRVISDGLFPTPKVVGGFDFVGDDYDPFDPVNAVPQPDPDPMDQHQSGHGTHVAGIAAGFGVTGAGATYTGPYGPDTPFDSMQIGPGAAPRALLYALKVFGQGDASFIIIPAIEWAVDPNQDGDFSDHLDVINLSLGEDYAPNDDPEATACDNAVLAGVVVVSSAGNDGDVYFAVGSPGSAPSVISVAATEDEDPDQSALSADRLATFSSRGPSQGGSRLLLKPDLSAPGRAIRSARLFRPTDPTILSSVLSGTSMASPHVAGIAALLRELHPDWSVQQIKALLMNTATYNVFRLENYGLPREAPAHAGAGRVNPPYAVSNQVIAYDADFPERAGITFATREVVTQVLEYRRVRVENKGDAPASFTAALDVVTACPGVDTFVNPANTGVIAPGQSVDIEIGIQADASRMRHLRDAAARGGINEHTRHWPSEFSGYVTLTPVGVAADPLRVPFYGTMRRASDMRAVQTGLDFNASPNLNLAFTGSGVNTGEEYPFDIISLVTPFVLLDFDENEAETEGLDDVADLKYIGVTSDYAAAGSVAASTIYFGIATWAPWYTLNWVRFDIHIDTNDDGTADFLLYSSSNPLESTQPFDSDVYVSRLNNFGDTDTIQGYINGFGANQYDSVPFLTDVLYLPVKAEALGLSAANPDFGFRVKTTVRVDNEDPMRDESDPLSFNIAAPGLTFSMGEGGLPTHFDLKETVIPVSYDAAAFTANGALGALLLHHHNPDGKRAAWLPILTTGDSDGDSILDTVEGGADPDGDGMPNMFDLDSDGDGIPDFIEGAGNADNDSLPNFLDTDSDNDGVLDSVEWTLPRTDPYNADSDSDGLSDAIEGKLDTDGDGTIDALDTDSDDDGIPDTIERDGDPDDDGLPNYRDLDSDGDGIPDEEESVGDLDDDGIPNYLDLDSDGDTLSDADERTVYNTDPYRKDSDLDGRTDDAEIEAGTDPLAPQPPGPATNLAASDGTSADHVLLTWDDVPGLTEYRVYRSSDTILDNAQPLSDWLSVAQYLDTTAAPARQVTAACRKPTAEYVRYTYWVYTRNPGGEGEFSAPDEGYRGLPAAKWAGTFLITTLAVAWVMMSRRKRRENR